MTTRGKNNRIAKGRKRIIFHVSTGKTGTSSIQNYLYHNSEKLNICYPKTSMDWNHLRKDIDSCYYRNYAHHQLSAAGVRAKQTHELPKWYRHYDIHEHQLMLKDLCAEIKRENKQDTIISSEMGLLGIFSSSSCNRAYFIDMFTELVADYELLAVLHVRNLFDFTKSKFWSATLEGRSAKYERTQEDFSRFCLEQKIPNYPSFANRWLSTPFFDHENFIVKVYDKSLLMGGNVVYDFIRTLGIDCDLKEVNGNPHAAENISYDKFDRFFFPKAFYESDANIEMMNNYVLFAEKFFNEKEKIIFLRGFPESFGDLAR